MQPREMCSVDDRCCSVTQASSAAFAERTQKPLIFKIWRQKIVSPFVAVRYKSEAAGV